MEPAPTHISFFLCCSNPRPSPDLFGGLNGSTQHVPEVYSQASENPKFVVGVDLSAALLCSDPTGNIRLGFCSSGSIVVRARLCFRSSRVARTLRITEVHFHPRSTESSGLLVGAVGIETTMLAQKYRVLTALQPTRYGQSLLFITWAGYQTRKQILQSLRACCVQGKSHRSC